MPLAPDPRRRRRGVLGLLGVTAMLVASLGAGYAGAMLHDRTTGRPTITVAQPAGTPDVERPAGSVAGVAAAVLPSVVSIEVTFGGGQASGSGFVIDPDGYLLTNNHVIAQVAGGGQIDVVFSDGSHEEATVVGRTTPYDLAVLEVARTGMPALEFARSSTVVVGDPVVAVGAPLGLESTVTSGIVSALNRPVSAGEGNDSAFINAIQTDAAINPGNSGGPLVNLDGQVIGVNSAIARAPGLEGAGGGNIGVGFAIPSDQAVRTAEEIIETGRATYPVIGVLLDSSYRGEGVRVSQEPPGDGRPIITPGGPADRAGIQPGDVIVAFEGRPVTDPDELIVAIRARRPGDTVTLTIRRGDTERDVELVLDEVESN
jgi:putative serine protease PepD